jgi:hypothetical protein
LLAPPSARSTIAAGLIGQLRATQNVTRLAKYSAELYTGLGAGTGQPTAFASNGASRAPRPGAGAVTRHEGTRGPRSISVPWPLLALM